MRRFDGFDRFSIIDTLERVEEDNKEFLSEILEELKELQHSGNEWVYTIIDKIEDKLEE